MPGKVFLVGAGPGDPGLITVKGLECICAADVVIYDFLAAPELLRHARRDAQIIYVGKKGGDHTLSQDGINSLIVEKAKQGFTVTRLKGGDPFVFGRGGEEAQILAGQGIAFEIVPGVTSAISAPAYAGIPLTHRDFTATVAFVTGHEDPNKADSNIDWAALAKIGTLVFFMGVKNLPQITQNLLENGKSPATPAALVRWGTKPEQQTLVGTLDDIAKKAVAQGLKPPAIFIVGEVVSLRGELSWFENRPLFGRRIVVTRSREQASDLVKSLSALGAACLEIPAIEITEPPDFAPLDKAIAQLGQYQWLVFTSVNAV
ncbi:MAG: uroporphyrinogen-III C-methyltransferase, partial [Desulfatibacillaceae bacterium]|nr:uroporphyrinogen-III C-methyltransferase [Desulfatibacillaceae bacterium]